MNKLKKILLSVIAAAGVSCLIGAAACSQAPDYYKLVFEGQGLDYVLQDSLEQFVSGGTVKEGVEVRFKVSVGAASTGDPVILLNGEQLVPDADGVYSFVMNGESVVTATGVSLWRTVTFDKMQTVEVDAEGSETLQEVRIDFYDEDGNELDDEVKVVNGGSLKFRLFVSPYYVREKTDSSGKTVPAYTVSCNSDILDPDEDGYYTISDLTSDATVAVSTLEQDDAFPFRTDGGSGTASDPYNIARPIDLYYMAALVNSNFWTTYLDKYYKMTADIDMEGEQLYVIGDYSSSTAVFCGHFDGDGHTIKNFYITDEVIDQESFAHEYLPYVGLFGCVQATSGEPATIENVVLEDYEVRVHPGAAKSSSFVGSLVGFGTGVRISGCKLNGGEVEATGDDSQMIYMGGVAGVLQSAYFDNGDGTYILYDSYVFATLADIEVIGTGSPYCAGGIVGYLSSSDATSIAYVSNCTSLGAVTGGMNTGGIVGIMGSYTSVSDCYASGAITSNNTLNLDNLNEDYKVAYAGGIAGFAEANTVIADCYSASTFLNASSLYGANYAKKDYILACGVAAGYLSVDSYAPVIENCANGNAQYDFVTKLGWNSKEWELTGAYPVPINSSEARTVTVTVKYGNTVLGTYEKTSSVATPLSGWYLDGDIPEYIEDGGQMSWGYFFAEENGGLTRRIPCGFVLRRDITVYVGLADYSDVAGTYYIEKTEYANGAYFTLNADGTLDFRYGGMSFSGNYEYDGEKLYLLYTCFASLKYGADEYDGAYYTLSGVKNGNCITLSCAVDVISGTSTVSENMELKAYGKLDGFGYGQYAGANETFVFNENGSGTYSGSRESLTFTYTYADDAINLVLSNGGAWNGVVANGVVQSVNGTALSLLDVLAGKWSKGANTSLYYEFDGLGGVTYNGKSGTYELDGGAVRMTFGEEVVDGTVSGGKLSVDGAVYCLNDPFTGKWYFKSSDGSEFIEVTLDGMTSEGYGSAVIGYTTSKISEIEAQYDVYTAGSYTYVRIYVGDSQYGGLKFDAAKNVLDGQFYSLRDDDYYDSAAFKLYDNFTGVWVSDAEDFDSVTFNGKGAYESERGTVTVRTPSNVIISGTYTLTDSKSGTMIIGSGSSALTYSIEYDEDDNRVTFTLNDTEDVELLVRRDVWYGLKLYDEQGNCYEFDGKGLVTGTMTVSDGNKYNYKVESDGRLTVTIGSSSVTLTTDNDGKFKLGDKALTLNTGFAGTWILGGKDARTVTVSEVDCYLKATVTKASTEEYAAFDYNPVSEELTYSYTVNGAVVTITITLDGETGLSIYESGVGGDTLYRCVRQDRLDGWQGKTYGTESGASISFDGLGYTGAGGTAFYTESGKTVEYNYTVNEFGDPFIINIARLFVEVADGGFTVGDGEDEYGFVIPDALYRKTVWVNSGESGSEKYEFDGISKLYSVSGGSYDVAYDYTFVSSTEVKLTDADGNEYIGTLKTQGYKIILTIEEEK